MTKQMQNSASGFTLIELLVVVLIIGILAAVALPQYQVAVAKSRLSALIPIVDGYKKSLELYYLSNGEYPADSGEDLGWVIEAPANCSGASTSYGIRCPNGVIFDVLDYGTPNIFGGNTNTKNGYLRWAENSAHPNETRCLALATDKVANQVCKSMGGQEITGETYRWAAEQLGGTLKIYKL